MQKCESSASACGKLEAPQFLRQHCGWMTGYSEVIIPFNAELTRRRLLKIPTVRLRPAVVSLKSVFHMQTKRRNDYRAAIFVIPGIHDVL